MNCAGKAALAVFCALFGAGGVASAPLDTAATAADAILLMPHRAVYDLKITRLRYSSIAEPVNGRIFYDFSGNSCEGYALRFRQVSELDIGEGKGAVSDLRATTWEDGAATTYHFNSQNRVDEKTVESVDGQAQRGKAGVAVNLTKPAAKNFQTDPSLVFPTEHLRRIIAAAHAGEALLVVPVYDGSENGEKIFSTTTVIGRPIPPDQRIPADAAAGRAELAGLTRWPVTISYFDQGAKAGAQMPDFSFGFELYENGISRALVLDYGNFVVSGEMTTLEIGTIKPCP
ncbi:MAG: cell envelope integrity EipB family protein [Xanthobacteraceae bacterium]